jgi:hypothetical protein
VGGSATSGTASAAATSASSTTSAGSGGHGGGSADCYDADGVGHFGDGYAPMPAGNNACTAAQITGFVAACVQGSAQACNDFRDANPTCSACAFSGYATGIEPYASYYPLIVGPEGADWWYLNSVPCHAAMAGRLDCAVPVSNYSLCYASACAGCSVSSGSELDDCMAFAAIQTIPFCEDIVIPAGCDAIEPSAQCDGASFTSAVTAVLTTMCRP